MKKVLISSTLQDMEALRAKVVAAIKKSGYEPVVCEHWPADDRSPESLSVAAVREVEAYVCVICARYGTALSEDDPRSYTEIEFIEATEVECKRLVFIEKMPRTDG